MRYVRMLLVLCIAGLAVSGCSDDTDMRVESQGGTDEAVAPSIFAFVGLDDHTLHFYDPTDDRHAVVNLLALPGYSGGPPLHAYIADAGTKVYVGYNGDDTHPSGLAVIQIDTIHWETHTADVTLLKDLVLDSPARPNTFPTVTQVSPIQPFQSWTAQLFSQLHGPAEIPGQRRLLWTTLTDDRLLTVGLDDDEWLPVRTFGENSKFLHGIQPNPRGNRALGAGYFYDRGFLPRYRVEGDSLVSNGRVWLGTQRTHAAFVHNIEWITNRWAVVGTMQIGPTSLTPDGQSIIGPSVWLIDSVDNEAIQILGPTLSVDGAGVFRSASWVEVIGTKLFVGEEASLGDVFGQDGYVSVFDIKRRNHPVFLKRLKPGVELPSDFVVGHAFQVTPDAKSLVMESYVSGYIVRIGVESMNVEYVLPSLRPHGGSIIATTVDRRDVPRSRAGIEEGVVFEDDLPEDEGDEKPAP